MAEATYQCEGCPVRQDCLAEYYLEVGVTVGGMSWDERKRAIKAGTVPAGTKSELQTILSDPSRGLSYLQVELGLDRPTLKAVAGRRERGGAA